MRLSGHVAQIDADRWPHADAIAELALPRFAAGEGQAPDRAEPYYVRDRVAKTTRERLEGAR
jgi:tRNA threonylcarbamoyladenosine biosynthesis protein TsaB